MIFRPISGFWTSFCAETRAQAQPDRAGLPMPRRTVKLVDFLVMYVEIRGKNVYRQFQNNPAHHFCVPRKQRRGHYLSICMLNYCVSNLYLS